MRKRTLLENRRLESLLKYFVKKGYLLHGTTKDVKIIKPGYTFDFNHCGYFGNLNAVYATEEPTVALFFAITPNKAFKKFDIVSDSKKIVKKFFLEERYIKRLSNGYVYILASKGFVKLGGSLVSFKPVKPFSKIKVCPSDFKYKINAVERLKQYKHSPRIRIDFNKALAVVKRNIAGINCQHGLAHILRASTFAKIMAITMCPQYINEIIIGIMLHDIDRKNDSFDLSHPKRSADKAKQLIKKYWPGLAMNKIIYAIENHHKGQVSNDPIIGIIWDADRLDLVRLGIDIDKRLLSTKIATRLIPFAKLICAKMQ